MLNPKLYEHYDASVINAFRTLAQRTEESGEHIAVFGVNTDHGTKAPNLVYTLNYGVTTIEELLKIFHEYAPRATENDIEDFGAIFLIEGSLLWEKRKNEFIELWFK